MRGSIQEEKHLVVGKRPILGTIILSQGRRIMVSSFCAMNSKILPSNYLQPESISTTATQIIQLGIGCLFCILFFEKIMRKLMTALFMIYFYRTRISSFLSKTSTDLSTNTPSGLHVPRTPLRTASCKSKPTHSSKKESTGRYFCVSTSHRFNHDHVTLTMTVFSRDGSALAKSNFWNPASSNGLVLFLPKDVSCSR